MITLHNFQDHISQFQLDKGYDYFMDDRVKKLKQVSPGVWNAIVNGSRVYHVELKFKGEELVETSCDCPHEDEFCKHVTAVLWTLAEETDEQESDADVADETSTQKIPDEKKKPAKDQFSFHDLLKKVKDKQLREFISDYSRSDREFRNLFMIRFSSLINQPDEKKFEAIVKRLVASYKGRYADVDYYKAIELGSAISKLLSHGDEMLAQKNYLDVFQLSFAVIPQVFHALLNADDSTGILQECIYKGFEMLQQIISSDASFDLKEKIFSAAMEEASHPEYEDYDFYENWLNLLKEAAASEEQWAEVLMLIERMLKRATEKAAEFRHQTLLENKMEILKQLNRHDEARQVLLENLHHYDFRMQLIQGNLQQQNFSAAKQLIEEAKSQEGEKGKGNINSRWDDLQLEIYQADKDTASVRRLALQLFESRDYNMEHYKIFKSTFNPKYWEREVKKIIQRMKDRSKHSVPVQALAKVYIEEGYLDCLLELVQKNQNIDFAEQYFTILKEKYPHELVVIYKEAIRRYAEHFLGRNHYEYVRDTLKKLQGIPGGNEMVHALAIELKVKYRQRTAMVEELNKVVL